MPGGPTPAVLEVARSHVRIGDGYAATFAVVGYPAEVGPAWLDPLLTYPGRVDVAVHVEPVPAVLAAPMLRRQRARLESSRRLDADAGRLADPLVNAAATDAADLAERLARGAAKLFRTGIYLTVHARTLPDLEQACADVRAAAASVLLDLQPATFRHHHGYTTTLPLGLDRLGIRRVLDTTALAAAFPFASNDLPAPTPGTVATGDAVLLGVNTTSTGVLMWDRWAQDNHNSVVLARSGAGKSYLVKLDVLRNLYHGVHVAVIDPEDEYTALAHHVGGTVHQLGRPGVHLNPLALPAHDRRPDTLTRRGLHLHTLTAVMLGEPPTPAQRAALDTAITTTYTTAGITHDPATWTRPAPHLADLATTLTTSTDPHAHDLATRLHPWTHGTFATLFTTPATNPQPTSASVSASASASRAGTVAGSPLTVWSLRHLPDEVRAVATLLALDTIWHDIDTPTTDSPDSPAVADDDPDDIVTVDTAADDGPAGRGQRPGSGVGPVRRLVVVDEAWLLMRDGEGARFLFRMAKAARKRGAGLTVVTQDAADLLGSDLGLAVVSNAATQILMRQAPQAIDAITAAFSLTSGEARLLLNATQGEGLLIAGHTRIGFRALASPTETTVCRSGLPHPDHPQPGSSRTARPTTDHGDHA